MYCQKVCGDVNFCIEEWNKINDSIKDAGLTEAEENLILFGDGKECEEQCFACMAIIGGRRLKTQQLKNN